MWYNADMKRKITAIFEKWKKNGARKPLLVYGARQVGKSYAIREFGLQSYPSFIEVDFERDASVRTIFNADLDPQSIIRSL